MNNRPRTTLILLCVMMFALAAATYAADQTQHSGMVVGKTGEVLHISVPGPLPEGSILSVKAIDSGEPIARVRVLSCTQERPFIALAKAVDEGISADIPTGVHVFAEHIPETKLHPIDATDRPVRRDTAARFSLQTGAFYPSSGSLRQSAGNYWQSYRLNYTPIKLNRADVVLSAEYMRGTGSQITDGITTRRTMEVIPLTAMARVQPFRLGATHLYLGAGAGVYSVSDQQTMGNSSTSETSRKAGLEYLFGLETKSGWVLEMRYRDIRNTDIRGYALSVGGRF